MLKIKQLITFLILSNLLTLAFVCYSYVQHNIQQELYFLDEIQAPLAQLQATINYQKENKWENPELVSYQASTVQNALEQVLDESHFAHSKLTKQEQTNLFQIKKALQKLPQNTEYKIVKWKKEDQRKAIAFEMVLNKAKLSNDVTNHVDYKGFMKQCQIVANELKE